MPAQGRSHTLSSGSDQQTEPRSRQRLEQNSFGRGSARALGNSEPEWCRPRTRPCASGSFVVSFLGDRPRIIALLWRRMRNFAGAVCVPLLVICLIPPAAGAQSTPSIAGPAAYNAQPGTVPAGVASAVFNDGGGQLDFAVLEQKTNGGSDLVEIFHGQSDGTFCTNCKNANPNPDVILLGPSGSTVKGNSIAVGQFRSSGPRDIAVATNTGIVFLQNNGSGTFTLNSNAISAANGFLSLVVGQFGANSNYDIAAVAPSVSGSISFTVFYGDGSGAFPTQSSPVSVSNTYSQCSAIMQANFQGQTTGADLALLCNNPSEASVLVYLNSGSGAFTFSQAPYTGSALYGELPGVTVGTLNNQAAIFVSPVADSFMSYQSNGLAGQSNAFTGVAMIPVGLAPRGSLTILYDPPTGAIDFATGSSGVDVSSFTSYTQSGTSLNGSWSSTQSLGPGGTLAVGFSPNLAQGGAYVVVSAGVHAGSYPNYEPYVDERSIGVFIVTLNTSGTVATTNVAPVYSGSGRSGYSFPSSFATGDFNGDGVMDLAVSGADNTTGDAALTIYLANSDGSLPATTSLPVATVSNTPYSGVDAVVAGKFRPPQGGKKLYDLAVFSFGQISILTSNGDGTFGAGNSYFLSGDPNYPGFFYNPSGGHRFAAVLTAADVNGDGNDDIVLTLPEDNCNGSGSVSQGAAYVLISNGDGTFKSPVFVAPPVVDPVSVTAAKFFGGSLPDLVFANGGEICSGNSATTTGAAVGVLQNDGSGNLMNPKAILTQATDLGVPNITAVATADLNGDGIPDLVVSSTNGIQVLLNEGGGSFKATAQGVVPLYAGDVVPGPLCNAAAGYVGCVTYDSQVATGSFFAPGENDVAVSTNGVAYIFQNQNSSGTLLLPSQGFVAGPDSSMISGALAGPNGLSSLLVATSQGTTDLVNSGAKAGPSFANYSSIGPIDFVTNVSTASTQQLVLSNTGGAAFTISSIALSGASSAFSVSNVVCNGATVFPFSSASLGPGQTCTITLQFAPTSVGNGQAELLTILDTASNSNASPAPQSNGQSILLVGDATQPTGGPSFANYSNIGPLDFVTNVNTANSQQLVLTNTGGAAFTVSSIGLSGASNAFSVTNVVCNGATDYPLVSVSLGPGQTCTITLQFAPTRYGNGQAELLTILDTASNSNASSSPKSNGQSLLLLGDSRRPYARFSYYGTPTTSLGVGTYPENTTITNPITVTNTGNGPLTLNLVYFNSILGPPVSNGFYYTQIICNGAAAQFPVILNYNQSCTITVGFDPPAAGNFSANLYVLDDAQPGESNLPSSAAGSIYLQAFPLSGTGFAPKADVSISAYAVGNGYTGLAYTFATQIMNSGPDAATNLTVNYSFSSPVQFVSLGDGFGLNCPLPAAGSTISSFRCNSGTLGVRTSIVFFLLVTPLTTGTLTLTATINSRALTPTPQIIQRWPLGKSLLRRFPPHQAFLFLRPVLRLLRGTPRPLSPWPISMATETITSQS